MLAAFAASALAWLLALSASDEVGLATREVCPPPKRPHHVRAKPVPSHTYAATDARYAIQCTPVEDSDRATLVRTYDTFGAIYAFVLCRPGPLAATQFLAEDDLERRQRDAASGGFGVCVCVCHVCNNMTWQHRHVARVRCRARRVTCCHCLQCLSRIAVAPGLTPLVRKQLLSSSGRAFPKGRTHGVLAGAQDCRTAN